jgi:hypothetical protein
MKKKQPQTGYWLQHMANGRFVLTNVTDIMGGPKCWSTEWVVRW